MINYVTKDEEFTAVVKLTTREEIVCKCIVTDEDDDTSVVVISDPVVVETIKKKIESEQGTREVVAVTFTKWMQHSDSEFFILRESDIITIAPVSDEMKNYYSIFIAQCEGEDIEEVTADKINGYVGTIPQFRKSLEKIYKGPSYFK